MKGYSRNFVRLKNLVMKKTGALISFFLLFALSACSGKVPATVASPEPAPKPQILAPVHWDWKAIETAKTTHPNAKRHEKKNSIGNQHSEK